MSDNATVLAMRFRLPCHIGHLKTLFTRRFGQAPSGSIRLNSQLNVLVQL